MNERYILCEQTKMLCFAVRSRETQLGAGFAERFGILHEEGKLKLKFTITGVNFVAFDKIFESIVHMQPLQFYSAFSSSLADNFSCHFESET